MACIFSLAFFCFERFWNLSMISIGPTGNYVNDSTQGMETVRMTLI